MVPDTVLISYSRTPNITTVLILEYKVIYCGTQKKGGGEDSKANWISFVPGTASSYLTGGLCSRTRIYQLFSDSQIPYII